MASKLETPKFTELIYGKACRTLLTVLGKERT